MKAVPGLLCRSLRQTDHSDSDPLNRRPRAVSSCTRRYNAPGVHAAARRADLPDGLPGPVARPAAPLDDRYPGCPAVQQPVRRGQLLDRLAVTAGQRDHQH
jgi:hypothetical protein